MDRLHCRIRPVTEDDRPDLLLLAEETLRELAAAAGHPERYVRARLLEVLTPGDAFVAETPDGGLAGFVAVERREDELAVRCICVQPACEGRGVANQLLDWAEGMAVAEHLSRVTAIVPASDAPSLHLYRGHGFEAHPRSPELLALEKRRVAAA